MLSAGGIRQQFSLPENVLMSTYGIDFIKSLQQDDKDTSPQTGNDEDNIDVQFHENGYLFLATQPDVLTANHTIQRQCGVDWMDLLDSTELKAKFPWLNTEGIEIGSTSRKNEGYFDPWAFVKTMKQRAMSLGVEYADGDVARAYSADGKTIESVSMTTQSGESVDVKGRYFVNAAGAWASPLIDKLAAGLGRTLPTLPVERRKRCVFIIHCKPGNEAAIVPPASTPLVIDPQGVYFRPEGDGGRFITGVSPPEHEDPACEDADLEVVQHELFEDTIWPALANRVPAFEEIKVVGSWAGFYDYNTVDQNAIIGYHPEVSNVLLCNGFSGHGLQQAPAAGRAIAELIMHNKFTTLDLGTFSYERILQGKPVFETGIV
jgi:FAD-dependent oxidoreductase domain-containing protein 1